MALELRFDPEAEVGDGRDAERVVTARGAHSLSDMLGLRDADREGGASTGESEVEGTTAVINASSNKGGSKNPVIRRTRAAISCHSIPNQVL